MSEDGSFNNRIIYYCGLSLAIISLLLRETFWARENIFVELLKLSAFCLLSLNLVMSINKYTSLEKLICLFCLVCFLVIGINTHKMMPLLLTIEMIIGAKGVSFDKILKIFLLVGGCLCVLTIMGSLVGLLDTFVVDSSYREDVSIIYTSTQRYSFGYVWPTDLSSHIFFLQLIYFYLRKGRLRIIEMLIFVTISIIILKYTDARLPFGCSIMLLFFALYLRRYVSLSKKLLVLLILVTPLSAIIIYVLSSNYDSTDERWIILNLFFSNRLEYGHENLDENGISFLGQFFEMHGGGYELEHNMIDSSFLQAIIIYGIVYSLILCIAAYNILKRAYKRNDAVLIIAMTLCAIHAIFAQHYIQLEMNPFWLALVAKFDKNRLLIKQQLALWKK